DMAPVRDPAHARTGAQRRAGTVAGRPAPGRGPRAVGGVSTYALKSVFAPASVALVGASPRERSLGRLVLRQLLDGGFAGPVGLVTPRYASIEGVAAVRRLEALPFAPELVIIASPPADVAAAAAAAAERGA